MQLLKYEANTGDNDTDVVFEKWYFLLFTFLFKVSTFFRQNFHTHTQIYIYIYTDIKRERE